MYLTNPNDFIINGKNNYLIPYIIEFVYSLFSFLISFILFVNAILTISAHKNQKIVLFGVGLGLGCWNLACLVTNIHILFFQWNQVFTFICDFVNNTLALVAAGGTCVLLIERLHAFCNAEFYDDVKINYSYIVLLLILIPVAASCVLPLCDVFIPETVTTVYWLGCTTVAAFGLILICLKCYKRLKIEKMLKNNLNRRYVYVEEQANVKLYLSFVIIHCITSYIAYGLYILQRYGLLPIIKFYYTMISERIITLTCYLIICGLGLIVNLFCLYKICNLREFRHCFGYICICQLISNILTCTIFLVWSCPSLFFLENTTSYETLNLIFGRLGILAWNLTMYSHLASCFNRVVAMFFPTKYARIFDKNVIIFIISCIWILSFCHVIPYIVSDCTYKFSIRNLTWQFTFTKCTTILTTIDLYMSLSIVGISLFFDTLIFIKLGFQAKKTNSVQVISLHSKVQINAHETGNKNIKKVKKSKSCSSYNNRIRFFLQSFVQNILIAIELICFHIIVYFSTDKLWSMAFSSCAWALCHTLDGIILCIFNKEIRKEVPCLR
uniref:G_PROTEIN_RECEP_F1_2 domain-containing protein n=1 Tax=Parastrongyloides trichosuri TaxID=131310 RepID=A0A0N4Z4R8_PARTI